MGPVDRDLAERAVLALERIAAALEGGPVKTRKPAKKKKDPAVARAAAEKADFYLRRHGHYPSRHGAEKSEGDSVRVPPGKVAGSSHGRR